MTKNTPTWTAELRNATSVLATSQFVSDDLRSRALEIYTGAKVGSKLTDMNVEFINAMRSRFEYSTQPDHLDPAKIFDRHWGKAWDLANP